MRVLVVYGSKRGGTAGLSALMGEALAARGIDVDVRPAKEVRAPEPYDAVIVAGALYATRWHRDARRFVRRNADALRRMPVWLVSSGPLDDTARAGQLPAVPQVAKLMTRVGARGHMTFGGRLTPDPTGFVAKAMAKKLTGDWRDPEQVREFADAVVRDLAATKNA